MWICRLWCDFEEILTDSIFFYAGKRGEVVGGVGGAGGGGGEAPLPLRNLLYCTVSEHIMIDVLIHWYMTQK